MSILPKQADNFKYDAVAFEEANSAPRCVRFRTRHLLAAIVIMGRWMAKPAAGA